MNHCTCCKTIIKDDVCVNCCVCKKIFKSICVKLSRTEASKINANTGISWTCGNCLQLGNDLNGLKSAIISLQEEIKVLKATSAPSPRTLMETEEIIQEVRERERRKCNVVVHGVEDARCNSKEEQLISDRATIREVFNVIGFESGDNIKHYRLGKYDATKVDLKRPIKICLSSESDVYKLLKRCRNLKESGRFSRVYISRDQTPFQSKLYKAVKLELHDRLSKGESNIKIKFKNGAPQIVTSLN